jgi:hypothetical protein
MKRSCYVYAMSPKISMTTLPIEWAKIGASFSPDDVINQNDLFKPPNLLLELDMRSEVGQYVLWEQDTEIFCCIPSIGNNSHIQYFLF